MERLAGYTELYNCLRALSENLHERGAVKLAELIVQASRFVAGTIGTEFLDESRIALRCVVDEKPVILTAKELDDARQALAQPDEVLAGSEGRGE